MEVNSLQQEVREINNTKTVFMYCKYYLGASFKRLNKKDNKKE